MKLFLGLLSFLVLMAPPMPLIAQNQTKSPLELRIKLRQEKVCLNGNLDLELKVTNKSRRIVVIDPGLLGYETVFTWSENSEGELESGMISWIANPGPYYRPRYVFLYPKQSYKKTSSLILDDAKFTFGRVYNLSISYGQFSRSMFHSIPVYQGSVDSNQVPITIINCS